jgi:cobyric acid synthase
MKDELELDPMVLKKNLEITKLSRQKDLLISEIVDLKETKSQFQDLLIQENIDLKAQVLRLKDVITQLSDPLRR